MGISNAVMWRFRFSKPIVKKMFEASREENTITKYYEL
jgi:hypothetical protein